MCLKFTLNLKLFISKIRDVAIFLTRSLLASLNSFQAYSKQLYHFGKYLEDNFRILRYYFCLNCRWDKIENSCFTIYPLISLKNKSLTENK